MKNALVEEAGQRLRYIPGIDGLRAIAVVAVMVFHFSPRMLPGGFAGVDVFFVISGYVVTASLARSQNNAFAPFVASFYSRRLLRIYPALVVCLIASALLQSLFVPASWLSDNTNKSGIAAFFGLSNFALILLNDGYFSPRVEYNLFTHTWSLAVEEQFYILFPFLMFAWLKWRGRSTFAGAAARLALPALLFASLAICWAETGMAPERAYYLLPSRFWELAVGAMLVRVNLRCPQLAISTRRCGRLMAPLGLAFIAGGLYFSNSAEFPFPWALASALGTAIAIASVTAPTDEPGFVVRMLSSAPMVRVGKLSYSLYLWHWPVAVLFRWTFGLVTATQVAAASIIAVCAATLSYNWVERPIRRSAIVLNRQNWEIISWGLGSIATLTVVAAVLFKAQPTISQSVTSDRVEWYPQAWPGVSGSASQHDMRLRHRTLYVIGDSHTDAYTTMFQMLRDREGVRVLQFAKPGCPVAGLLVPRPDCVDFAKQALSSIRADATKGDIVFLASLRADRLSGEDARKVSIASSTPGQRAEAKTDAEVVIRSIEDAGLTVLIDAPKPVFRSPAFRCSDWFNAGNPACSDGLFMDRQWLLKSRSPVMKSLAELQQEHPRLVFWDPFNVLCPESPCKAVSNGAPLFFDGDHLSAHGNRVLYPSFLAVIQSIWDRVPSAQP